MRKSIITLCLVAISALASANPYFEIKMTVTDSSGEEKSGSTDYEGSAPLSATFSFEVSELGDYTMYFEWRFCHVDGTFEDPYMIRYEESPQVNFTDAKKDKIALYAYFVNGTDTIRYQKEYWEDPNVKPLTIKAMESELIFPNAFSPNGDNMNDFFKPKSYKSIIEFRAMIFNRWGQKIYEWDDITSNGWDGTFNGKDAKQGVYFLYVKAKGADGNIFEIKKDVNLLRSYDQESKPQDN